ncbi:MAG: lysyl-tRNA synthetase, class [Pyrinomonadaceae bacterium]|nr:lysyl-tRNA synthetase, class [Pyrinomonadaceae bacterium]
MTENNQTPFIEDNDQTRARREHLERIQQLTGNAYPNKFRRTNLTASAEGEDTITSVVAQFKHHEPPRAEGQRPTPEQLEAANAALKAFGDVRVSGRLAVPPRVMGKAAFVHLSDGRERLQIYVRRDDVQQLNHRGRTLDGWELFSLLDHGDFIGVEGFLFVTKTGELSVHVREFEFLAKALLPMPDKMHGISDPEIRQRQRYADLIAGSLKIDKDEEGGAAGAHELTTREVFERRSKIIREMRAFLDERGYIEVETPMLTPIASGAAARPFETTHNALGISLYARIAPELYLKRLLVGGFERVYELNRNFRNEGIDRTHNPEFTMLEFYCAYMDVNGMMDFCEEMLRQSVLTATGGASVKYGDTEIEFGDKFRRLTMNEAIAEYWPTDIKTDEIRESTFADPVQVERAHWFLSEIELRENKAVEQQRNYALNEYRQNKLSGSLKSGNLGIDLCKTEEDYLAIQPFEQTRESIRKENKDSLWEMALKRAISLFEKTPRSADETARQIVEMFERLVEPNLIQPTFIYNYPKPISPLSKASPDDPSVAERFELFINGMECANGFSELNDPVEQYERFREQGQARERGDEEAMQMDTDYVRALAYGMPPAAGIGIGIDRIVMLLTNRRSIRDVILFPHMRPAAAAPKVEEAATDETAESTNEQAGGQGA